MPESSGTPPRLLVGTDVYLLAILALLKFIELTGSVRVRDATANLATRAAYRVSRHKRNRVKAVLQNYFGTRYTAQELEQLARQTFYTFWQDVFMLCKIKPGDDIQKAQIEGVEHLEQALSQKRGVILLENSFFGLRNAVKLLLRAKGWHIHQTHLPDHLGGFSGYEHTTVHERLILPALETREKNFVASVLYFNTTGKLAYTRALAQLLGDNAAVYISGDGAFGYKHVEVEFFGRPHKFATGAVNLSRMTGAPILPLFGYRGTDNVLCLKIEPPLEFPNNAQAAEIGMQKFAARLQEYITRYPGHYRHWHKFESESNTAQNARGKE